MKICVIGTGYVGLVSGTCFAETGLTVTCVDINQTKIENLNKGIIPIYEPGLQELVDRNMKKGKLFFSTDLKSSIEGCEAAFIAVGTPPDEDGSADLKYVIGVAEEIGNHLKEYIVVVTKSTVPVGTANKVKEAVKRSLLKRNEETPFDVASNPEFLKEGAAIDDFMKPDRIVIGIESDRAEKIMERLYRPFLLNNHPIYFMDIASAELAKYAANAMLATRISFMNDIANLCEIVGADVNMVRKAIGSDTRIGTKFLYPGAGYGGSCFPKDVKALIKTAQDSKYELRVLKAVEEVNENQKMLIFDKIASHFENKLQGKKFALWGLSFKPMTDDMREAPSLSIISKLLENNASVCAYDPASIEEAERKLGHSIQYAKEPYEALIDADALIVITEWQEFRMPNFKVISKLLKQNLIFDGRNIYDPLEMADNGFIYYSIGRKTVFPK